MPKLTDALVKKVSLVARPANRRPFHMLKHEKDLPMAKRPAETEEPALKPLPEDVAKHIKEMVLAKSEDTPEMRAALEAIGVLAHSHPQLAIEDLLAVGQAAGLAKASKDSDDEDEDDDEDEEMDDEDVAEEADKQDKAPAFIRQQGKKKKDMAKSAEVIDLEKAERERVFKAMDAELKSLRKEFAKSQADLQVERDVRVTKSIKDELGRELRNLVVDTDALAPIIKSMRDAGNKDAAVKLMGVLKSADEQLALGNKSGSSIFGVVGKSARGTDGTRAMDRIQAETAKIAKSTGKSKPVAMSEYLNTAQGKADWAEHEAEELR